MTELGELGRQAEAATGPGATSGRVAAVDGGERCDGGSRGTASEGEGKGWQEAGRGGRGEGERAREREVQARSEG